jgi:bacillolysin
MKNQKLTRLMMLTCLLVASAFLPSPVSSSSTRPPSAAPAQTTAIAANPEAQKALARLRRTGQAPIRTEVSQKTGNYSFVRISGGDILAAADKSATPQTRARTFLAAHGDLVGMSDAERAAVSASESSGAGSNLRVARTTSDALGMTHVRLNQFYQGIPVFGAQLVVHMNDQGITAVNGDYVPRISLGTIPYVTQPVAAEAALASTRKNAAGENLKAGRIELAIYPAGLLEGRSVISRLAYSVEVAGEKTAEQVWIDAQTGAVLLRVPLHGGVESHHLLAAIRSGEPGPLRPTERRRSSASIAVHQ